MKKTYEELNTIIDRFEKASPVCLSPLYWTYRNEFTELESDDALNAIIKALSNVFGSELVEFNLSQNVSLDDYIKQQGLVGEDELKEIIESYDEMVNFEKLYNGSIVLKESK